MSESVTTFIPGQLYSDKSSPKHPDAVILEYVGEDIGPEFKYHSGPKKYTPFGERDGVPSDDKSFGLIGFLKGEYFYPVDEKDLVGGK